MVVAVNKVDRAGAEAVHEFASLGFEVAVPVAAATGRGLAALVDAIASHLPASDAAPDQGRG